MRIQKNFDLTDLNTLRLPSVAENFVKIRNKEDLRVLGNASIEAQLPIKILGGGSNLVLSDKIEGLVIKVENSGRELISEDADSWRILCQAGEIWHDFVLWTLQNNYWGLENLSLIPGTVGAAPIQNIGAYGVEVKDFINEVVCWDLKKSEWLVISKQDCAFTYRDSLFKKPENSHLLVWEVVFQLPKKNKVHHEYGDIQKELQRLNKGINPQTISEAVINIRNAKLPDPRIIGNVGSFFKNPIVSKQKMEAIKNLYPQIVSYPYSSIEYKLAAGWLIEQTGWKGKRLGPVGMYDKQALVLINHGDAKAEDVWMVAKKVAQDVFDKFEIVIEPEPIRW
jgi:UDP-N-acetylmuramate dehydrogenase